MPPELREFRLVVPLLAQEASYFAASAKIASFLDNSIEESTQNYPVCRKKCSTEHTNIASYVMIELKTNRLRLRPFGESDLDQMAALMANQDFMRFSLGIFSREQTAAFLERVRKRDREGLPSQFAVLFGPEERLIGYCGFFAQVVDDVEEIEIGYRLHPDCWRQGLATEAARAVRDFGFDEVKLPRLISLIHPDNIASKRVAEKNGMTPEKDTMFRGFPTIVYSISRERQLAMKTDDAR